MTAAPLIDVETLRTILRIECQKGYIDVAVIGGLDRYLRNWARKAEDKITSPKMLARFRELKSYLPSVVAVHMNPRLEQDIAAEVAVVAEVLNTSITLAYEGMQLHI